MCSVRRPLLRRWLVLALLCAFVAFSFALFAAEEAHAKDPIGDAVGGATKQLDGGGGGGDRSGGGDSGGGGGKKEGPLSDSPVAADKPKPALADTEPVTKKEASGDLLDGASGERTDRVLSSEPILKTTSPTLDPTPTLAPAVEGTKDALEGVARPVSGEPIPTTSETIRPLVEGVEEAAPPPLKTATEPLIDEAERLTSQPAALVEGAPQLVDSALEEATKSTGAPLVEAVDGAVAPIREALDLVLGKMAEPLLKTAEPLLSPVDGPVLGEAVAPTTPLGDTPAAPTPAGQIPAAELYTPVGSGIPALSPTTGSDPGTEAFEPAAAPLFEPFTVGEGASLPVLEAVEAPATVPPTVPSSVLVATESTTLAPSPAPNHAVEAAAAAAEAAAVVPREVSTMPVLSPHHRLATLGTTVLGAAPTSWVEGFFLRDAPSPFSPASLPVAGAAIGGFAGAGNGLGLGLLGALALILALARVDTLLRSARETLGASSYLQLAIERPG